MLENYHTHTTRCYHAHGADEEYVLSAIANGLQVLGFSDHTPFLFPDGYYSGMRMYPDELKDYVRSVLALKKKYAGQIEIRLGLEVEYYPDRIPALLELIRPYGIEYLILGQHWCGNEENEPYNGSATYSEALLARYCDQCIAGLKTGLFSYLAHPDLLHFVGDDAIYRRHMERLCQAAKELNIPLELNFLGLLDHRHYPDERFWEIAGKVGNQVVFGVDAHDPKDLDTTQTEKDAMELVRKYNLNLLERVPIHPYI